MQADASGSGLQKAPQEDWFISKRSKKFDWTAYQALLEAKESGKQLSSEQESQLAKLTAEHKLLEDVPGFEAPPVKSKETGTVTPSTKYTPNILVVPRERTDSGEIRTPQEILRRVRENLFREGNRVVGETLLEEAVVFFESDDPMLNLIMVRSGLYKFHIQTQRTYLHNQEIVQYNFNFPRDERNNWRRTLEVATNGSFKNDISTTDMSAHPFFRDWNTPAAAAGGGAAAAAGSSRTATSATTAAGRSATANAKTAAGLEVSRYSYSNRHDS